MEKEYLKYYNLDKVYKKVLASERVPERSWRDIQYKTSQHDISSEVFAMTDNGLVIAYYNHIDNEWIVLSRYNFTEVVYWLEEI